MILCLIYVLQGIGNSSVNRCNYPAIASSLEAHNFNMCVNDSFEEKYSVHRGYVIDKTFKAVHLCNGGSFLVYDAQSDD